jgi:putative transposase
VIAEVLEEHPKMSTKRLCELLGVSCSWYYEKLSGEQKGRDLALRDAVERIVLEFPGYGYRRVTKALQREGWVVNHKRVLRVMREESLLCQIKRRFKATTDSSHSLRRYPNLLKGDDGVVDAPDRAWSADITYIRLPAAFCYLASIIDEYSRYCVGWHLSRFIDTRLALAALEMALSSRCPNAGFVHHSDQGVQGGFNQWSQHRGLAAMLAGH